MSCPSWNESLIGRLYDEIDPADDAALEAHLATCAPCRETLADLRRVRGILSADEPALARAPRVVVLRARGGWRPTALAASILGAALLGGAGVGAGYALGQRPAPAESVATTAPATHTASPAALDPATEALIRNEVERRVGAALAASNRGPSPAPAGVSAEDLRAELARLERKVNAARANDLDYMLGEIQAAEYRSETRIGKTNQALRNVALASNGLVSAQ